MARSLNNTHPAPDARVPQRALESDRHGARHDVVVLAVHDERRDRVLARADTSERVDRIEPFLGGGGGEGGAVIEEGGRAVEQEGEGVRFLEEGENELGSGVFGTQPAQTGRFAGTGGVGVVACDLCVWTSVGR